ncbi:MAG: SCP2 sterol-binding domain-containing protein [Acidimicrobiales bacterium]
MSAPHPFLSDEWIEAARELRGRYAGRSPEPPVPARINVVVTDIPHRDGPLDGHIDSSAGQLLVEHGHLDGPDLTITVNYGTARAAFIDGDPQAVMQAFIAGKILVEGDVSKLMALQAAGPAAAAEGGNELAAEIQQQLQAITAAD